MKKYNKLEIPMSQYIDALMITCAVLIVGIAMAMAMAITMTIMMIGNVGASEKRLKFDIEQKRLQLPDELSSMLKRGMRAVKRIAFIVASRLRSWGRVVAGRAELVPKCQSDCIIGALWMEYNGDRPDTSRKWNILPKSERWGKLRFAVEREEGGMERW